MLKIITAQQTKTLDAHTIAHEPIASIDLMERACRAFVTWFTQRFDDRHTVGIVCGTGNNGGDGLGIARLLQGWNYAVTVWIVRGEMAESPDFKINLERLKKTRIKILEITDAPDGSLFAGSDVLLDAVFGSGLSRPPQGVYEQVITCINATATRRIAVDIPSGLMADQVTTGACVEAHATVTFQLPKLSFFFPSCHRYVGDWTVVDILLNKEFIRDLPGDHFFLQQKDVRKQVRKRSTFDHKGTYGHALLVAGARGKMGAAVLSSRAALRSGVGLLTAHVPQAGVDVLQTAVPEAMLSIDAHAEYSTHIKLADRYTAVGIGPGLGKSAETVKALKKLLEDFQHPLVLDADALNILAEHRELLHLVPPGCILTPHPKEFERIVGPWQNDFERLQKQKQLAAELKAVVVLKGAYSSIAAPDGKVYFNPTGNPGMATGGSGDVLTGILTGLLAQGYATLAAAQVGVYLHGLAGDLAAGEKGMTSLIASDLIDFLPEAYRRLG